MRVLVTVFAWFGAAFLMTALAAAMIEEWRLSPQHPSNPPAPLPAPIHTVSAPADRLP
jgi:hypothetical protein